MSSREFTLFGQFFLLEPWGCEVENWRMGMVAATVANSTPRAPGSKAKVFKSSDFYVNPYEKRPDDWTPEQRAFIAKRKGKKRNG